MASYTVHEPPRRTSDTLAHAERFVFVRDGFTWSAFLFGPLWMMRHRLWLALLGYALLVTCLLIGLRSLGAPASSTSMIIALVALLAGIEASTLRRWTLARRGWTASGVVVADDLEAAERRFFDAWIERGDIDRSPPEPAGSAPRGSGAATQDVIGLFPEPGART